MDNAGNMKALFIITNACFAENVLETAREAGAKGATILNVRGEGARHKSIIGITVDIEKDIIMCVVDENTAEKTMVAIKEKAGAMLPAHCICFTMPVDKIVGVMGTN